MQSLPTESIAARRGRNRRGNVLVELSLIAPWIFFLFIGIVDLGFYSYALISVENATRIAAEYTSQSSTSAADQAGACAKVKAELANLPNVASLTSWPCTAAPLTVTASSGPGPDGGAATSVSISYESMSMIPIPGLLMGKLYVTRNIQMRVRP